MREVFEKATTQHHFIDMYADLCDLLNMHFSEHPINDDPKSNFKKVLLHCCQASFEKHLTPPKGLAALNSEERTVAERLYKMRMLGNIKFVGSLLVRKMLASKVMLAIMEELLQEPTPEALESLAALLTVVGPTFDTPDWAYRMTLDAIFKQVEKLTKKSTTDKRVTCVLKDVLDLRKLDWEDRRPKKIEGPLKLKQVAEKAEMETGAMCGTMSRKSTTFSNDWDTVGKERLSKLSALLNKSPTQSPAQTPTSKPQPVATPKVEKTPEKWAKGSGAGAAMLDFLKNRDKPAAEPEKPFDREAVAMEVAKTLSELSVSHDVKEAIVRVANIAVPAQEQASQLDDMLARMAEEGTEGSRKAGFSLVVGLIVEGHWKAESAVKGLRTFVEETAPDLKCDVPTLPKILKEELHPALAPVVKAGLLEVSLQDLLLSL